MQGVSIMKAFLWCFISVIAGFVLIVILTVGIGVNLSTDWIIAIITILPFLTLIWKLKRKGITLSYIWGNSNRFPTKRTWVYLLTVHFSIIVFSLSAVFSLLYLVIIISPNFIIEQILLDFEYDNTQIDSILSSIFLPVVIAPIVEEYIFRGFLFKKLYEKNGLMVSAIISSSVFSILHLNLGFVGHFVFGIFLCFIFLQTRNLWVPIILHSLHNLILTVAILITDTSSGNEVMNVDDILSGIKLYGEISFYTVLFTLFIVIFLLRRFYLNIKKTKDQF